MGDLSALPLAPIGGVLGGAALAVAIFRSCPTICSGDGTVEEAELFSSSIAPLFEGRDLDRLRAQPDASGVLRLDVRNEAMETPYINHLQLIEVEHAPDKFVLPNAQGEGIEASPRRAQDGTALQAFFRTSRSSNSPTTLLSTTRRSVLT